MGTDFDPTRFRKTLRLLGEWMDAVQAEPVDWIVIGGSALPASEGVTRALLLGDE